MSAPKLTPTEEPIYRLGREWMTGRRDPVAVQQAATDFRTVLQANPDSHWALEGMDRMTGKDGHQQIMRYLVQSQVAQTVEEIADALQQTKRWVSPKLSGAQRGRWLAFDDGQEGYWMPTAVAIDWVLRNP